MEVPWDDVHQPHSLLLWLLGFHSKQKIPQKLLCLKLALYLLQSFMGQQVAMCLIFSDGVRRLRQITATKIDKKNQHGCSLSCKCYNKKSMPWACAGV